MRSISLFLMLLMIAACSDEIVIVPDETTVKAVTGGQVIGYASAESAVAWRGIPFAATTAGKSRWKAPQPVEGWEGVLEATTSAPHCLQEGGTAGAADTTEYVGDEDCLYLDVYAPANHKGKPLPVMLWIHGGANVTGGSDYIDGSQLAQQQDVIVVAIQYRLGVFGWFAHPELDYTMGDTANFAVLDMIAALNWVQDNIGQFGGDASNVTLFGESAGGA